MSRYQAYSEYKETNTDWLGSAPKHWKVIPVGRLFRRIKRTKQTDKELLSVYRDYGVIPKASRDDNNNRASEDLSPYQLVEPNDLVMNKMKTWQGSIAISEYEGIVSPAYFVYQPSGRLFDLAHPKYVHYLLRNPMYIAQYQRRSKGIRVSQWDLDPEEFQRIELLLPEKDEQLKIFQFLDHETAKIDTLIEKQQQLIKLLNEKRQAVISHAVTKGLNPNAHMCDSNVEWLGEMPAHWTVSKVKWIVEMTGRIGYRGYTVNDIVDEGEGAIVLSPSNINVRGFNLENKVFLSWDKYFESPEIILEPGDVMLVKTSWSFGKVAVVSEVSSPMTINPQMLLLKRSKIDSRFVSYFLNTDALQARIFMINTGSYMPTMTQENVGKLPMFIPPNDEAKDIADFIEGQCVKFSTLLDKQESVIGLLQERRTALISAAVTGKIDVRSWQVPKSSSQGAINGG